MHKIAIEVKILTSIFMLFNALLLYSMSIHNVSGMQYFSLLIVLWCIACQTLLEFIDVVCRPWRFRLQYFYRIRHGRLGTIQTSYDLKNFMEKQNLNNKIHTIFADYALLSFASAATLLR
jgi:hypothetical protein